MNPHSRLKTKSSNITSLYLSLTLPPTLVLAAHLGTRLECGLDDATAHGLGHEPLGCLRLSPLASILICALSTTLLACLVVPVDVDLGVERWVVIIISMMVMCY